MWPESDGAVPECIKEGCHGRPDQQVYGIRARSGAITIATRKFASTGADDLGFEVASQVAAGAMLVVSLDQWRAAAGWRSWSAAFWESQSACSR